MPRALGKHFVILMCGTGLNMVVGLLTAPLITRLVEPTAYGELSLFTTYGGIALMIFGLGMDQVLVRFFHEEDSNGYRRRLLLVCWVIPMMALAVVALFYGIATLFWSAEPLFGSAENSALFIVYSAALIMQRLSFLVVRLKFQTILLSFLNVSQKLIYASMAVVLLLYSSMGDFEALAFATTLGVGVSCVISIIVQRKLWYWKGMDASLPFSATAMFKYGIPLAVASGVSMIFQATDRLVLQWFCTYEDIGIYASALNLISVFAVVQTSFNQLWAPSIVENYAKDKNDRSLYIRGFEYISLGMFLFGATVMIAREPLALLLGESYRSAAGLIPFLAFHPIMYTISEASSVGITLMKKSRYQLYVAVASCVFNALLCIALVPVLGTLGAAISIGLAYILFFVLRTYFSSKIFDLNLGLGKTTVSVLLLLVLATACSLTTGLDPVSIIAYLLCIAVVMSSHREALIRVVGILKMKISKRVSK